MLLFAAILWGSAFSAQRVAAQHIGVHLFNGLRFLTGTLVLLPLLLRRRSAGLGGKKGFHPGVVLAGVLIFAGSTFQQAGLRQTTAANAGFITGLYVVIVPLVLFFGRKRALPVTGWISSLIATVGLFLLSTGGRFSLAPGDSLELIGAFLFALHVLTIGRLVRTTDVLVISIGQYLVCGALSLGTSFFFETNNMAALSGVWWTIAYTGIASIALGYTLQVAGQSEAPPVDAAILLSSEAVFAAVFGWILLGEGLSPLQMAGSGLLLAAMLLVQAPVFIQQAASRREKGVP